MKQVPCWYELPYEHKLSALCFLFKKVCYDGPQNFRELVKQECDVSVDRWSPYKTWPEMFVDKAPRDVFIQGRTLLPLSALKSIDDIEWSIRIENACRQKGIVFLFQLIIITEEEIVGQWRSVGSKYLKELKEKLLEEGLLLGTPESLVKELLKRLIDTETPWKIREEENRDVPVLPVVK